MLIEHFNFPWEVLPSHMLRDPAIWEALVPRMGLTALIRNLGRLTDIGFIKPFSDGETAIVKRLENGDDITKSRVHPLQILTAEAVYRRGAGLKGSLTWTPSAKVLSALDRAFYASFGNVEPTGKRTLNCLDVSGSMSGGNIAGSPLTPREASVALALLSLNIEPLVTTMAFSDEFMHLPLQKEMPLGAAVEATSRLPFSGTDCALPMIWAEANSIEVDTFVVYTDSETWSGAVHPFQALRSYRLAMGIDARLAVVGMTSTGFSIADPTDPGMLDVVGFDTATPNLISEFSRGSV
jgi:60 kDa SS-A/Ro ribonucleoprotein